MFSMVFGWRLRPTCFDERILLGQFSVVGVSQAFLATVPRDQFLLHGLCHWLWKRAPLRWFNILGLLVFDRTPPSLMAIREARKSKKKKGQKKHKNNNRNKVKRHT